jgi:hypothetical protein
MNDEFVWVNDRLKRERVLLVILVEKRTKKKYWNKGSFVAGCIISNNGSSW